MGLSDRALASHGQGPGFEPWCWERHLRRRNSCAHRPMFSTKAISVYPHPKRVKLFSASSVTSHFVSPSQSLILFLHPVIVMDFQYLKIHFFIMVPCRFLGGAHCFHVDSCKCSTDPPLRSLQIPKSKDLEPMLELTELVNGWGKFKCSWISSQTFPVFWGMSTSNLVRCITPIQLMLTVQTLK